MNVAGAYETAQLLDDVELAGVNFENGGHSFFPSAIFFTQSGQVKYFPIFQPFSRAQIVMYFLPAVQSQTCTAPHASHITPAINPIMISPIRSF